MLRAVVTLNQNAAEPAFDPRAPQLLAALTVRQRFERELWAASKDPLPTSDPKLHLAYCGRLLEAIGWAKLAITPSSAQPDKNDAATDCALAVTRLIAERRQAMQVEGAHWMEPVSHALRGMRMLRRTRWPAASEKSATSP